jgi:hypothetical protein
MVVIKNKFSETFINDLEMFMIWLSKNEYCLNDIVTGEKVEMNIDLINFNEPSRSKLECYVKELVKYYLLEKDNEEIDDIKTMIKEFRTNKIRKGIKKSKITKVKKVDKSEVEVEVVVDKSEVEVEDVVDKSEVEVEDVVDKSEVIKNKVDVIKDVIVKEDLNTDDICYIDTLDFSTKELEGVFGKPLKNGKRGDKHQYEWKIIMITEQEDIIYSIYNWRYKNGKFDEYDENEWFLGTMKRCKNDNLFGCDMMIDYIKGKINRDNEGGNNIESKIQEDVIMKLFKLSDKNLEIIDIDDICF